MKVSTPSQRLKDYLETHNLRQADIVTMCQPVSEKLGIKFAASDISQYISGRAEPGPEKVKVLAEALDVDDIWIMGYDVEPKWSKQDAYEYTADYVEKLIKLSKELSPEGRRLLLERGEALKTLGLTAETYNK
jgi:transcriptional regulator with XRE-family HTH domain